MFDIHIYTELTITQPLTEPYKPPINIMDLLYFVHINYNYPYEGGEMLENHFPPF